MLQTCHANISFHLTGPGSLRMLYEEDWQPTTKRSFVKYWYDTVEDKEVREVIGPEPLKPKGKVLNDEKISKVGQFRHLLTV